MFVILSGELSTREPLDRELRSVYELVAEAKDQGLPSRSSRVAVRIRVTDVNDNAPVLDDPQEDVISVREEQPPGTEVVRVRAVDPDDGYNATLTYSLLKGTYVVYSLRRNINCGLLTMIFCSKVEIPTATVCSLSIR